MKLHSLRKYEIVIGMPKSTRDYVNDDAADQRGEQRSPIMFYGHDTEDLHRFVPRCTETQGLS